MIVADISSNIRIIEKILEIGKIHSNEENNLPFFNPFYESFHLPKSTILRKDWKSDLPLVSITHDVLKDRNIILYQEAQDLVITLDD